MGTALIRNIGVIVSGDPERPLLDGDAILVRDGRIQAVGRERELDAAAADTVVDVAGTTMMPGLIDTHVHLGAVADGGRPHPRAGEPTKEVPKKDDGFRQLRWGPAAPDALGGSGALDVVKR